MMDEAPPDGVPVLLWRDKSIKTICLEEDESYNYTDDDFAPIYEHIELILKKSYYVIFLDEGCDAVLTIEARGTPVAGSYTAGTLFTGVEISGLVRLTAPGYPELTHTFQGKIQPPEELTWYGDSPPRQKPEAAPFWEAVEEQINNGLVNWFGPGLN
jgi:hypothetical protein